MSASNAGTLSFGKARMHPLRGFRNSIGGFLVVVAWQQARTLKTEGFGLAKGRKGFQGLKPCESQKAFSLALGRFCLQN